MPVFGMPLSAEKEKEREGDRDDKRKREREGEREREVCDYSFCEPTNELET
jgi:hypothetical protein